jgi:hypothetical protein
MHTITVDVPVRKDPRLGRIQVHDSRSLKFAAARRSLRPKKKNTLWGSGAAVLNQGDLGSCTGNAAAQWLNTDFATVARQRVKPTGFLNERDAVSFYTLASQVDSIAGSYPPEDTGSSGLGVAKAIQRLGYITKYGHTFSFTSFQATVEQQPVIVGTVWTNQMSDPVKGLVTVGRINDSTIDGGHEYLVAGIDWVAGVIICRNSWGDVGQWNGCKPGGYFAITFSDFQKLLSYEGDVTVLYV